MIKKLTTYLIIIVAVSFIYSWSFELNHRNIEYVQYDQSGDGLKNYYTFAYQLIHEKGVHFSGFLYPWGDLTFFTDSQYSLVFSLKLLSFLVQLRPLFIINFLTLLSFVLGGILLFEILRNRGVPILFAIIFGVFGIMMSPQLLRVPSHFGLAYPVFFLSSILLIEKQLSNGDSLISYRTCLVLVSISVISAFIHPYNLLITSLFLGIIGLIFLVKKQSVGIQVLFCSILPVLVYQLIFFLIDKTDDRPQNPFGIWHYQSGFDDLLPGFGILGQHFNQRKVSLYLDEGYCYLTFIVYVVFTVSILMFCIRRVRGQSFNLELRKWEVVLFISSLLCFLFANGFHLKLFGERILEVIPQLRQFRALGRFSWPLYYVSFITASVLTYRMFIKGNKRLVQLAISLTLFLFMSLELNSYHADINKIVRKYKTKDLLNNEQTIATLLSNSDSSFQAIIPIPPSTEGAEKFNLQTDYFIKTRSLPYSYQTQTPLTDAIMSRVSLNKMIRSLELTNSRYGYKEFVKSNFPSTEPFLVVVNKEYQEDYLDVLERGSFINQDDKISLYKIELDSILKQDIYSIGEVSADLRDLHFNTLDRCNYYFESFDQNDGIGIDNRKGRYLNEKGTHQILNEPICLSDSVYELSFWQKLIPAKSNVPHFKVELIQSDSIIKLDQFRDWDMKRVEVYKDWVRFHRHYEIPREVDRVTFSVTGEHIILDNILFKALSQDVHYTIDSTLAYSNGYFVKLSSEANSK